MDGTGRGRAGDSETVDRWSAPRENSVVMDVIVERLDSRLLQWKPDVSEEVRAPVSEIIELADNDALDVMRSRAVEQEVLDLLDEPLSR